jgi:CO dehydrogenase maturation factor
MMRLAIAGKGGAGKTTLTATLARLLARRGRHVNAVDDDPNPNLSVALGLDEKARSGLRRVPREEVMEERVDSLGNATLHLTRPFEEIVRDYGARGPDDVNVLTMTGLLGAGKG